MNGRKITAAAIQMSSTPNKGENLETAERLIHAAVSSGADLVALPELWSCHGLEKAYRQNAEPVPGPTTEFLANMAKKLGVYVLGGSILEGDPSSPKLHNTSTFYGPDGEMSAVYRKIHLFDVKAPDREYLESETIAPGAKVVTAKAGVATLGLSVCYDVRFPELYLVAGAPRRGGARGPCRLHAADGQGPLGAPASGAGRREPGLRCRACPVGAEGRRPVDLRAFGRR